MDCIDFDLFKTVGKHERENGRSRGFFVAFGYTREAEVECAAYHKRTGRIIKRLAVREIFDEESVRKI